MRSGIVIFSIDPKEWLTGKIHLC